MLVLFACLAQAERVILIPLDSRPATGQFAQMIGKIDGVDVIMPPYDDLGRFTTPGNSDAILDWLSQQDLSDVSAVIASADMICYGGLIESRVHSVDSDLAMQRIHKMADMIRKQPNIKLYVFSATMRLLPTATTKASKYRMQLGLYEEQKAKYDMTSDPQAMKLAKFYRPSVPQAEIDSYESTRRRNYAVQQGLIRMQAHGDFDYLVLGQDDARPYGPHVPETERLKKQVVQLNVSDKVFFCEGVDQHACVLLSRALLQEANWQPKVRVVYADDQGKNLFANFESKPIKDSLADQLEASGARLAEPNEACDYTLYLNTPGRREDAFKEFVANLSSDIDHDLPVAIADIDLSGSGTSDPELFSALWEKRRVMKLASFAGWNTAGNTMGTAIPEANLFLLARRTPSVDPVQREVAQREFLLHRFVNDFAYHRYTRTRAYEIIEQDHHGNPDEIYGDEYDKINAFVQQDLSQWLGAYFQEQFLGGKFYAGDKEYAVTGINNVKIWLPWPRAYEVRLEFTLQANPVMAQSPTAVNTATLPPPLLTGRG